MIAVLSLASGIAMFAGTWTSSGSIGTSDSPKPTQVRGTNVCRWSSAAHAFLVCDGVATIGSSTVQNHQLSVYTYDSASKHYGFVSIAGAHVGSPDLTLSGNTWTYSGKFTDAAGRTTYFRTLNVFDSPTRYRYIIESSNDGTHWTQTGSGVSTRK